MFLRLLWFKKPQIPLSTTFYKHIKKIERQVKICGSASQAKTAIEVMVSNSQRLSAKFSIMLKIGQVRVGEAQQSSKNICKNQCCFGLGSSIFAATCSLQLSMAAPKPIGTTKVTFGHLPETSPLGTYATGWSTWPMTLSKKSHNSMENFKSVTKWVLPNSNSTCRSNMPLRIIAWIRHIKKWRKFRRILWRLSTPNSI